MKSEHLAEAKRNVRSWPLLTIINYNDTITFNDDDNNDEENDDNNDNNDNNNNI